MTWRPHVTFAFHGNFTSGSERSGVEPGRHSMDLAPLVRAVEALMSPEAWGSRDAWLAECLRRVREVRGAPGQALPADAVTELEALLHLPGDEPGWLQATFESLDAERWDGGALPAMT